MEECHVPQRSPEHGDAPVLSNECDMRWVQCEHCHFWHHWVCAMYDDTQYKKGRPYYCQKCAATYEPVTLTLTRTLTLTLTVTLTLTLTQALTCRCS